MNEKKNLVMAVIQNNTPGIETICKLIYINTFFKKRINSIYVFSKIQLVVYYQCCILIG